MVVIDTNIVSELMRGEPSAEVLAWIDDRSAQELFVTAVTEAEVRTGIASLPERRRRRGLASVLSAPCLPEECCHLMVTRPAPTRRSPRCAVCLGVPLPMRTARLWRSLARVAWRWQRATYETSRTWGSKYSTHGTVHERNGARHSSRCPPPALHLHVWAHLPAPINCRWQRPSPLRNPSTASASGSAARSVCRRRLRAAASGASVPGVP